MRRSLRRPAALTAVASAAALAAAFAAGPGVASIAAAPIQLGLRQQVGASGNESKDIRSQIAQFGGARTAPGNLRPGAYTAAYDHVASMGPSPVAWTEVTTKGYNADNPSYRDLVAGNSSGGVGFVTGRITGLAVDSAGWIYAGGAEGGVFRSSDEGDHWTPISDRLPALATGDLRINPADQSLWLATGEADFGDGLGGGVYRLTSPHDQTFTTASRIGGNELESHSIAKLEFDVDAGVVFAATSRGVYRHAAVVGPSSPAAVAPWTVALAPTRSTETGFTAVSNIANDVVVQPGTGGRRLIANIAYAFGGGGAKNGFYLSNDTGATWTQVNPGGAINPKEIGVTEFAYSADGRKLYAVVESTVLVNKAGADTALAGVYVSNSGDVAGPYSQIANTTKLANSGSAMKQTTIGKGYGPGIQAWYNRFVQVDPANSQHVYVGLEEVYESFNGGSTWSAAGRYWNFGLSCWSYLDSQNTCDGNVVHPDQHSVAIGNGKVYVGNDGGLYSRSLSQGASSWRSLSKSGQLGTLQYYSVGVGTVPGGVAVWGGLQDNGHSLLTPAVPDQMVSPFGGDGGDQIVDPDHGCRAVGEYVNLDVEFTTNCGQSDGSTRAIVDINPLDPNPQFIAPLAADPVTHNWVAAGQFVYRNTRTWTSTKGSDWDIVGDNGSFGSGVFHSATAIASQDDVIWSGWCGSCSSSQWKSGIMTTYDPSKPHNRGALHATGTAVVDAAGNPVLDKDGKPVQLPQRYVAGLTIAPTDPSGKTAYAVYNGFSAHYVEGPGAGIGHVFKTRDGGAHWTDISGSATATTGLPDAPASHLAITPSTHTLVVTTDVGVFTSADDGATWLRTNMPYTIATDVRNGPDGNAYVATYGRGIWKAPLT
ncbi:MAG: glycosyl hydrolase [Frankiales bacterium]|nr:glycosyl hydrolase [Frankiales bacterium]